MNQPADSLKLHLEANPLDAQPQLRGSAELTAVAAGLKKLTGWSLEYAGGANSRRADVLRSEIPVWSKDVAEPEGAAPGRMVLRPQNRSDAYISLAEVQPLAEAVADLLSELHRTRYALWQREAELATAVPLVPHREEAAHIADRLASVLQGGTEAVGCQAAALYMLDETTSELKLRASFGLPTEKLMEAARPLRGAVADLEALIGHAVTLEDVSLLPHWKSPEPGFGAAVCVPVASATVPLGTLWFFSSQPRSFKPAETNIAEIIASTITLELEREILLSRQTEQRGDQKQLAQVKQMRADQLPRFSPLIDGFEVAGRLTSPETLSGQFFDWQVLADGSLAVAVGGVTGSAEAANGSPSDDLPSALAAASVQTALKAHSQHKHDARKLLGEVTQTIWSGSAGDQTAALLYGVIRPQTGDVAYSSAGGTCGWIIRSTRDEPLKGESQSVGSDPEHLYKLHRQLLCAGDLFVAITPPLGLKSSSAKSSGAKSSTGEGNSLSPERLKTTVVKTALRRRRLSAEQLAEEIAAALKKENAGPLAVVVVKRDR